MGFQVAAITIRWCSTVAEGRTGPLEHNAGGIPVSTVVLHFPGRKGRSMAAIMWSSVRGSSTAYGKRRVSLFVFFPTFTDSSLTDGGVSLVIVIIALVVVNFATFDFLKPHLISSRLDG